MHIIYAKNIKEILLINSYHTGYKWTDDLSKGVIDVFNEDEDYRVFVEYMDYKRFQHKGFFYELSKLYQFKYEGLDIDGIIIADNYAFQFFLEKGDSIWSKDVPIVACGVNNIETINYDTKRIKAVREDIDVKNTLNCAFALNPLTDTLILISDQTLSGKIFLSQFEEGLKEINNNIPYIVIDGSNYEVIHEKIRSISPKNKAIILLSLYSNKYKIPLEMKHLGKELLENIDIPVYSCWEFLLGDLITGGSLISSYDQGHDAAQILKKRIENPNTDIPDLTPSRYHLIFDYNKILQYKIDTSLIPKNSKLINKEIPFYQKHRKKLIYYLSTLIMLVLLNFFLISNIISRKKTQLKLIESEKRLELALDSANEGLWDILIDENKMVCNDNFAKLLGYNSKDEIELNIESWQEKVFKDDLPYIIKSFKIHLHKLSALFYAEVRIFLKNGDLKWFSIHGKITERDINNKPLRITGILMDISSQKEFELQLKRAKEKAEESDRLKSSFLANMSHEIRTPMNAIMGFSDILLSQSLDVEDKEKYLEQIKISGENLLNIINDIVDISKIESGQLLIRKENFEIKSLINNIELTARALIKSKNKEIDFIIEDNIGDELFSINSDPFRLEQILLNLISNAIKFTQHGSITLSINKSEFDDIIFKVIDTGEGISSEDINIIFERFRQAERTTNTNAGTGLGLAISKSLTMLMGGKIEVQSKLKAGSTFTVNIPNGKS